MAMRTSPTNIGLQFLATVSAYDLGFITLDDMTERLERAFRSLERMRRFRGHFYNWYDLQRPARARAGVHLHGGQRQPRRTPHRAAAGLSATIADTDAVESTPASSQATAGASRERAQAYAVAMDFEFLFDDERKLFSIGYQLGIAHARRLVLRPARLRGAARELHRDRQERRAGGALVPARPHADLRARRDATLVSWSGSMFEYLMPALVMRSFPSDRARPDLSRRGAAADRLRRRARRAVGHQRERLQRARPPPHLSVPRASACPTSRSSADWAAIW